jgi:hypothetical protein
MDTVTLNDPDTSFRSSAASRFANRHRRHGSGGLDRACTITEAIPGNYSNTTGHDQPTAVRKLARHAAIDRTTIVCTIQTATAACAGRISQTGDHPR